MHVFGYDVRVYHVFRTNKSSRASRTQFASCFLVRNMACKGKRVRSDTKAVVCNVYDYFERESKKNKKIHQGIVKLKKKMGDATGLSKCTVVCYRGGKV